MPKDTLTSLALLVVLHEGGHFFVALIRGLHPKPGIGWVQYGKVKLPFFVIHIDETGDYNYRFFGAAGFGGAILGALVLVLLLGTKGAWVTREFIVCYLARLSLHWWTYSLWCKDSPANDFNKLDSDLDPDR